MLRYTIKRLLATIPVMGVVALFVFSLLYISPGDPAAVIAGDIEPDASFLEMLDLADAGISSIIFNAAKSGNIARALSGESVGTKVARSN